MVNAAFLYSESSFEETKGLRRETSPLDVKNTSFQIPKFLSGGVGFQSTQVIPKSFFPGANISTAKALALPGRRALLTLNSNVAKVPATSLASAIFCPFSQTLAR